MDETLHILHLEDDPNDAELVHEVLKISGLAAHTEHVSTRERYETALARGGVDLILSDFSLPDFDGFTALELARERVPDVPFIFVSGTLGEEAAVDSLKRGATDYVLKQRLSRLAPAARRALEEAAERRRRREAEDVLQNEQQFLKALLDSVEAGVVACDGDGAFTLFNRAAREIHGIPEASIPTDDWYTHYELSRPDGTSVLPAEASPLARALGGERLRNVELVIQPKQGPARTVLASAQPITAPGGETLGAVMAVHDITDRKLLEERLRHAQKMDAIGRLAGGVAHDFNNLLTVILGCSTIIDSQILPGDPIHDDLSEIERAAERAAGLTRQLLAFGRRQILKPSILDLNAVVTNIEQMMRRLIGPHIDFSAALAPGLGPVRADPGQLEQVILNLVVNARDAMPNGGRLTLETHETALEASPAHGFQVLNPGRYVELAVSDTGVGMDAETRSRIFEPFFTTKEPGKGTGLGLSTVHGIVKQSGGQVEVESAPGRGSTFRIYLPLADEAIQPKTANEESAAVGRGSGVVLVVEDETAVRAFMKRTLESGGYTVIEARDGEEALLACERNDPPIDLVVSDVLMPRMRGTELARRLAGSRPELKVLLVSGHPDPAILNESGEPAPEVLQKPFGAVTLLLKVRQVIESRCTA